MGIHFTADFHLGHRKVASERGFDTPGEHDDALFQRWVETVSRHDTVFVLGDLTMKTSVSGIESVVSLIAKLPGWKHLILGNHDAGHPMHSRAHFMLPLYREAFASVASAGTVKLGGQRFLLSHFPYAGDHTEIDRHTQWRLPNEGMPILHGHTHSADRLDGNQIHVGLDAWGLAPVTADSILEIKELGNA